ncbi:hypothetical protein [Bifidobacterium catenulatum]|uniref:hypothetical protein n=1 Tax=Bifidobacterium TaxID=1678 RepID=UPI0016510AB8|nr:hypothetical protein [Bifidobacterium catenulatum]
MDMDSYPFSTDPYRLRGRAFSIVGSMTSDSQWRDAALVSGRLSSWAFTNSILIAAQHRLEAERFDGMPADPTLLASKPQWARMGRYPKDGRTPYRIVEQDGTTLTTRYVFDVSQTDGEPFLQLAPSKPSATVFASMLDAMCEDLNVQPQADADPDMDPELVDPADRIHSTALLIARTLVMDGVPESLAETAALTAACMVCGAVGCDTAVDPFGFETGAEGLLLCGGIARKAARRIIAYCGRGTGYRDGSMLAPPPSSSDGAGLADMGEEAAMDVEPASASPLGLDNPVPPVQSIDFGGLE